MKPYRAIGEVFDDRRKGVNLSEVVDNILYSPYIMEQIETPFDVVGELHHDDYLDASTDAWKHLPVELQIKYSKAYQEWYARLSGHASIEGHFEISRNLDMAMMLIPPMAITMRTFMHEKKKRVLLKRFFWMGKYEVRQDEWLSVMGRNPSIFLGGDNFPVENIQPESASEFCKKIAMRIPTEYEWEMACRAGTTTEYSFGDDYLEFGHYGWYAGNSDAQTHPVGKKKPNAWGLHDMHGNVKEMCKHVTERYGMLQARRGGCWYMDRIPCRSGARDLMPLAVICSDVGLRVLKY